MKFKDPEGLLARLIDVLSAYDLTMEFRQDKMLGIVYCLGRALCKQCNTDHINIYIVKTGDDVFSSIPLNASKIKIRTLVQLKNGLYIIQI